MHTRRNHTHSIEYHDQLGSQSFVGREEMKNSNIPQNQVQSQNDPKFIHFSLFFSPLNRSTHFDTMKHSSITMNRVMKPIKYKIIPVISIRFDTSLRYSVSERIRANCNRELFEEKSFLSFTHLSTFFHDDSPHKYVQTNLRDW